MCDFIIKNVDYYLFQIKKIRSATVVSIQFNQVCECTLFSSLSVVKRNFITHFNHTKTIQMTSYRAVFHFCWNVIVFVLLLPRNVKNTIIHETNMQLFNLYIQQLQLVFFPLQRAHSLASSWSHDI